MISWSWLVAITVSIGAGVSWFLVAMLNAHFVWIFLAGPITAFLLAKLYDAREVPRANRRFWWVLIPAATHLIWSVALALLVDEVFGRNQLKGVDPILQGCSITALVFAFALMIAERSIVPFLVLVVVAVLVLAANWLPKQADVIAVHAALPGTFSALMFTTALMNHVSIRKRIRRPGRCIACSYLAMDLPRCPECGGPVAPLDGPIEHDRRLD